MKIGDRIKKRRLALKMSADALAQRIGKDRSTVYRYESGEIDKVSVDMLVPLAEALETTPAYLLGFERSMEFATAELNKADFFSAYASTNSSHVKKMERWYREFGDIEFTDKETEQIFSFAHYLLYMRSTNE